MRELVLLFLLKDLVAEADLLLAVLLGRLITVSGDLLYFILSCFIAPKIEIRFHHPLVLSKSMRISDIPKIRLSGLSNKSFGDVALGIVIANSLVDPSPSSGKET